MADTVEVPFYDPTKHTDPETVVRVELASTSGRMFRQVDPVRLVRPQVVDFVQRESEAGHEPASLRYALEGRPGHYQQESDDGVDPSDRAHGKVRPWPTVEED